MTSAVAGVLQPAGSYMVADMVTCAAVQCGCACGRAVVSAPPPLPQHTHMHTCIQRQHCSAPVYTHAHVRFHTSQARVCNFAASMLYGVQHALGWPRLHTVTVNSTSVWPTLWDRATNTTDVLPGKRKSVLAPSIVATAESCVRAVIVIRAVGLYAVALHVSWATHHTAHGRQRRSIH